MNNDKEHQFELLARQHKRTIYTVCYMFSTNKDEIGAIIGISPNNVGVRLTRIKEKLVKMS